MKPRSLVCSFLVAALVGTLVPGVAGAAQLPCVTKLLKEMNDFVVPGNCDTPAAAMKLVMVSKNGSWVSFAQGTFELQNGKIVADHIHQTFSDRYVSSQSDQNFAIGEADTISASIDPGTAIMTLRNHTWNGPARTVQLRCDGDALTGSDTSFVFAVVHSPTACVL
jgi:hypothetical protein